MNAEDCTQCDHASLDYPWICPGHPEPVGVELTEGEREILREGMCTLGPHERAIHEHAHDKRLECAVPAVERILAVRQAPTVALDVSTCMDALAGLEGVPAWWGGREFRDAAEKVVAADPRRTEADVKAEALREAAHAAVSEDEGIPWDDDYDRATVGAWLEERVDQTELSSNLRHTSE